MTLKEKIESLFDYRLLPYLFNLSPKLDDKFKHKLIGLQKSIYALDAYLENNWKIETEGLNKYWQLIHNQMRAFGLNSKSIEALSKVIYRYQHHELTLREGKNPLRFKLSYLYFYKSCDIKLMRKLIYRADQRLEELLPQSVWRNFDWITEINDDVDDLIEDQNTFNCNRFIFCLHQNGINKCREEVYNFFKEIQFKNKVLLQQYSQNLHVTYIVKKCEQAIEDTKALFEKRVSTIDPHSLSTSKVILQMKNSKI